MKKGFTLAETLIVLVILGIIAAITIPSLVRRHVEAQNRTKIKKSMTVYDTAINKMVIENGLKSNRALTDWGNNNNCVNTKQYFKVSQESENENKCIFKSADGVWWNIEDITHPIIAFNEDDLNKADEDNNKAFRLVGYLDDNGILRVSDLAKAEGDDKEYLTKLYDYANNVKSTSSGEEEAKSPFEACRKKGQDTCIVNGVTYTNTSIDVDYTYNKPYGEMCVLENEEWTCSTKSVAKKGNLYITVMRAPTRDVATSDENCATSNFSKCKNIGDYYNASRRMCESQGSNIRMANVAEIKSLIAQGVVSGNYRALEESGRGNDWSFNNKTGKVSSITSNSKGVADISVICVVSE